MPNIAYIKVILFLKCDVKTPQNSILNNAVFRIIIQFLIVVTLNKNYCVLRFP